MAQKNKLNIAQKSTLYVLLCMSGVLAFAAILLYPAQRSLDQLDREVFQHQEQLERQKILFPLYQELFKQIKLPDTKALPFPDEAELSKEDIGEIPSIFADLARIYKLEADVIPDVNSIPSGAGTLRVNATVQGSFFDFRNFLVELGGTPYLRHIEEIQVKAMPGFKQFTLKLWLALGE